MIDRYLKPFDEKTIIANTPPVGYRFTGWVGDIGFLDNPMSEIAIVTMPDNNVHIIAEYSPIPIAIVKFGLLYNWYAATDIRKITSSDSWLVPSYNMGVTLANFGGGYNVGGGKLKEVGTVHWEMGYPSSYNVGATNEFNFNARGAGYRSETGSYVSIGERGNFWATTEYYEGVGYVIQLMSGSGDIVTSGAFPRNRGNSIRLCNPTTTLSHGETGVYIGNDGQMYPTICIGTQEWISCNLTEAKYRNGDLISEITDATQWTGLTTGAMCAYDNDWNNV